LKARTYIVATVKTLVSTLSVVALAASATSQPKTKVIVDRDAVFLRGRVSPFGERVHDGLVENLSSGLEDHPSR